MRSVSRLAVVVLLLTGISAGEVYGQGGATGAISGVVVDTSGASIADAEVQIVDSRTDALARKGNRQRQYGANLSPAPLSQGCRNGLRRIDDCDLNRRRRAARCGYA